MTRLLYTSLNQQITLDRKLGSGGEGDVWTLVNRPDVVAKIYHLHKFTIERELKLKAMISNPPEDTMRQAPYHHISIAWPTELLYEQGKLVGYLMPYIPRRPTALEIYNPKIRSQKMPDFDWRFLHRTAQNFAAALEALHTRGYVMGDLNESNLLIADNALVTLVDTDSFQVPDGSGGVFRCPVGKPEYTPPELHGVDLNTIFRKPEHDYFGLAVLIFLLLMEGAHPFAGVLTDSMLSIGRVELYCIKQGAFPYDPQNGVVRPSPNALPLNILHRELQQLFIRCFVDGHSNPSARPRPAEWRQALDKAENSLTACQNDSKHYYSNHLKKCPWCERVQKLAQGQIPSQISRVQVQTPLQRPMPSASTPPASLQPQPTPIPSSSLLQPVPVHTLTWEDWWRGILPAAIIGALGGLGTAWGILFLFNNPDSSGGVGGVLTGIIIALIFFMIALAVEDAKWFYVITGLILAWFSGSFVASKISTFLSSYTVLPAWLYTIFSGFGAAYGIAGGNYKIMKKFNQPVLKVNFSTGILIVVPLALMIFTQAFTLPFLPNDALARSGASAPTSADDENSNQNPKVIPTSTETSKAVIPTLVPELVALCNQVYTAKSGDTISKIAGRFLNDILAYELIIETTNQAYAIDSTFTKLNNPDSLEVGDKLCIPTKSSQPDETLRPVATFTKIPPTPTARLTKTPQSIATRVRQSTATPRPSATPTQKPKTVSCERTAQGEFADLWYTYREQLGCPRHSNPVYGRFAEMPFEKGHLFWIGEIDIFGNVKQIIATFGGQNEGDRGSWSVHADTWNGEGICGVPAPPPGLHLPDRGIAKVWCEINGINRLGYATAPAEFVPNRGIDAIQNFENGIVFRDSDGHSRGLVYVLVWDSMTYFRISD